MKQVLQRLDTGNISLTDVPVPAAAGMRLVVRTRATLISAGTERMLLEFGRAGWIDKARKQPEKFREALDKVKTDGFAATADAIRSKLSMPIHLGYCNAGIVDAVGPRVQGFSPGDRVVTNGPHAEFVSVPQTLAARIPDGVADAHAAFAPLAAIALQGIRLAAPTIGETVVVYGLGLIGLLSVQLLRANGCQVIGIDSDPDRLALGQAFGASPLAAGESLSDAVLAATGGIGADAVLLTLASSSDEPVHQAAKMSRKRGRIVLVGVTGLSLSRDDFFKKELSFQVSCSYGPGRYDPQYEEAGQDYPLPFVRWTEQRNLTAVLALMAEQKLDPTRLVTTKMPFREAERAYELLGDRAQLGIVLTCDDRVDAARTVSVAPAARGRTSSGGVGIIGAGNFALRTVIPALKALNVPVRSVASTGGTAAAVAAQIAEAELATTDVDSLLDDDAIATVFVLTRHDSHADLAVRALRAGKHVFVEKPLAIELGELDRVEKEARTAAGLLTVGFNRRYAPAARDVARLLQNRRGPLAIVMTVNAGALQAEHWTRNVAIGGGRLTGEGCHFIDLARFFVRSSVVDCAAVEGRDVNGDRLDDVASVTLRYDDGSIATLNYLANGAPAFPKERIDLFFDGRSLTIDNWRRLRQYGRGVSRPWSARQDKGHRALIAAWLSSVRNGGPPPIPYDELFETSRLAIEAGSSGR